MPEAEGVSVEITVDLKTSPRELRRRLREALLGQVPGQLELPFPDDDGPAAA